MSFFAIDREPPSGSPPLEGRARVGVLRRQQAPTYYLGKLIPQHPHPSPPLKGVDRGSRSLVTSDRVATP